MVKVKSAMRLHKRLVTSLGFSIFLSFISSCVAYAIQLQANQAVNSCSYLDPIIIDIVALCAGIFLIAESLVDIVKHKESVFVQQLSRCARMCLGSSVVTIHIMQFLHK